MPSDWGADGKIGWEDGTEEAHPARVTTRAHRRTEERMDMSRSMTVDRYVEKQVCGIVVHTGQ